MTFEELEAIEHLRTAYRAAGARLGPECHTRTCLNLAQVRVFWPVAPDEEYPLYCGRCADKALAILGVVGVKATCEKLPEREDGRTRDITLEDE